MEFTTSQYLGKLNEGKKTHHLQKRKLKKHNTQYRYLGTNIHCVHHNAEENCRNITSYISSDDRGREHFQHRVCLKKKKILKK